MPSFTIAPDPSFWHEVPRKSEAEQFIAQRIHGLQGEARTFAKVMSEAALAARETSDDLTLLLQEAESSLYAIANFSLYDDQAPPASERDALRLVLALDASPWEPTTVAVDLGDVRGFRVSEFLSPEEPDGDSPDLTLLHLIQTTYVVSVGGMLGTVALTPAPSPAAGAVLALVEPVISTWKVSE